MEYEPRTESVYSDVDYMLLGYIIEELTNKSLDTFMRDTFYDILQLENVTFNPLENGFDKNQIAATEINGNTRENQIDFKNIRTNTIQGEVHDEKAFYSMDGISGHAGLFSNSLDLAQLAQIMLNNGGYGENKFFDKQVVEWFTIPNENNDTFGLGWRRQGNNYDYSWAFSPIASPNAYGHTGWTGTLTLIDPTEQLVIVLLTSKKNTPLIDKNLDTNVMEGDKFITGQYGSIVSIIYEIFSESSSDKLIDSTLIELFNQKQNQLNFENENNKTDKNSYKVLKEILLEYQDNSDDIKLFFKR